MWTTLSGEERSLTEFLSSANGRTVYIGTDSQRKKSKKKDQKRVVFSTVIAVVERNNNTVIKRMSEEDEFPSLRDRLLHEAWLSIEIAQEVSALIAEDVIIHLDINSDAKHDSGRYKKELCGFVAGLGFEYEIKPDAWCASAVADHQVR